MKRWRCAFVIFAVILVLSGAAYGFSVYKKYRDTLKEMSAAGVSDQEDSLPEADEGDDKELDPFALLLFGVSEREFLNDAGCSDAIMLAMVNPEEKKIHLISIPRDARVNIPGYGYGKINAAYPRGGAKLLINTVEEWLGIDILAYLSINYQGFIDLVDLAGGIEVIVPRDMRYDAPGDGTSINLKKGKHVLDGKNTLDFVRFRKSNDGRHDSDYDRMERQQQVLIALGEKMASLRFVNRIYQAMDILSDNVETSLTVGELHSLIKKFYSLNLQSIESTSIYGEGHRVDGIWYEIIPPAEMERIQGVINNFFQEGQKPIDQLAINILK